MVHGVAVASGEIEWSANLGGEQGFHKSPTLIGDGRVLLRGPEGLVALDSQTGHEVWRRNGLILLAPGLDETAIALEGDGLVVVNTQTGRSRPLFTAAYLEDFAWAGAVVKGDQLVTASWSGLRGHDLDTGEPLWMWNPSSPIVDVPAITEDIVAAPTADRAVSLIEIP